MLDGGVNKIIDYVFIEISPAAAWKSTKSMVPLLLRPVLGRHFQKLVSF
jgi:hypothetical protein